MNCPNCGAKLGTELAVRVRPIEFEFLVVLGADGRWRRAGDIVGHEIVDIDRPVPGTHLMTCPNCREKIDILTIKVVQACVRCKREKPKMTEAENLCHYEGLICLECAKAMNRSCRECNRFNKCALAARATTRE